MTKSIFRYLFAVLALSCVLTSCNDDDDESKSFFDQPTTFTEANGLCLKYSGDSLAGKQVVFTPNADKTQATLVVSGLPFTQAIGLDTLNLPTVGLIPGEATTTLTADMTIANEVATFSGEETKSNCTITYNGTAKKGALNLNVTVKMNANNLAGKSFQVNAAVFGAKPIHIDWKSDDFEIPGGKWNMDGLLKMTLMMAKIEGQSIPQMLAGVLHEVSFLEDGNIQAQYKDAPTDSLEWQTSPLNLATYTVESDSTLRLFIHPNQIAAFTKSVKSSKAVDLNSLFDSLFSFAAKFSIEGVVLEYKFDENGVLSVYLTQETLLPILNQVKPIFEDEAFIEMLIALMKENAGDMAAMVDGFVTPALKNMPMTIETTTHLDLGLDLDPVSAAN